LSFSTKSTHTRFVSSIRISDFEAGFSTCGLRKIFWRATALYCWIWVRFARCPSKTGAYVANENKI